MYNKIINDNERPIKLKHSYPYAGIKGVILTGIEQGLNMYCRNNPTDFQLIKKIVKNEDKFDTFFSFIDEEYFLKKNEAEQTLSIKKALNTIIQHKRGRVKKSA